MPRPSRLVSAIAMAVLSTAASAGLASAASPETGTIVRVELDLRASNGLHAQLETSEKKVATLTLTRKGREVTYSTQAEVTEEGLKVRFGRLGLIDVVFTPITTLSSTEPSEECTGEPRTLREGIFTGTIDFMGEREFVRIEEPQAEGSMSVISEWECPEGDDLAPFANTSRLSVPSSRAEKGSASLHASSRHCSCSFAAGVHFGNRGGRSIFYGAKAERREGMEIFRATSASAHASAFVFDHAAGTATLHPPRPFSGRATFERRPGRDLWRSTIRVPLLGADPLRAGGPRFRAALYPEYQFD